MLRLFSVRIAEWPPFGKNRLVRLLCVSFNLCVCVCVCFLPFGFEDIM